MADPDEALIEAIARALCAVNCDSGLAYFHDNDSRRNRAGFPDLVICGQSGFMFRELKTEKGRLRPEQLDWLSRLTQGGADAGIWRPSDLQPDGGRIKAELVALTRAA